MALNDKVKADIGYKKSAIGVSSTGVTGERPFFVEPNSPIVVYGNNILGKPDSIPLTVPSSPNPGETFDSSGNLTIDPDQAIIKYQEVVAVPYPGSGNNSYKISSWDGIILPFNLFSGIYAPKLFYNNLLGNQIPPGLNNWFFDTNSGTVTFYDGKPSGITTNSIGIKFWSYVGPKLDSSELGFNEFSKIEFLLDPNSPPINTTWNNSTGVWEITHNLGTTENLIWSIKENQEYIIPDSLIEVDANKINLTISGETDKSTETQTYPTLILKLISA